MPYLTREEKQKSRQNLAGFLIRERRGSNPHWLRPYPPENRVSTGGQGTFGRRLSRVQPINLIAFVVFRLADARPQRLA